MTIRSAPRTPSIPRLIPVTSLNPQSPFAKYRDTVRPASKKPAKIDVRVAKLNNSHSS